jgi:hypothetical protein
VDSAVPKREVGRQALPTAAGTSVDPRRTDKVVEQRCWVVGRDLDRFELVHLIQWTLGCLAVGLDYPRSSGHYASKNSSERMQTPER